MFLKEVYLHYTLLLLIPTKKTAIHEALYKFTLHFATINTKKSKLLEMRKKIFTLHFATINTNKKK